MAKKERIVRYSAEELAAKIARGESQTGLGARSRRCRRRRSSGSLTKRTGRCRQGWESTIIVGLPPRKRDVHIRLDADILDWFRAQGRGYQTRINAVLRAFVEARKKAAE